MRSTCTQTKSRTPCCCTNPPLSQRTSSIYLLLLEVHNNRTTACNTNTLYSKTMNFFLEVRNKFIWFTWIVLAFRSIIIIIINQGVKELTPWINKQAFLSMYVYFLGGCTGALPNTPSHHLFKFNQCQSIHQWFQCKGHLSNLSMPFLWCLILTEHWILILPIYWQDRQADPWDQEV